ncbi:MAG TPA: F0F1 ATP synthase subunit B [Gaiellaceae bacterium]
MIAASSPLTRIVPGLMIWTLVFFGLTFYVLKRFAFGRIQQLIDERRERIRKAIEEADKARAEARKLLEEHRKLIGQAKEEAEEIRSTARHEGDAQLRRVKEEAEADRRRRLEETKREIEAETRRALEQIRAEVAELSLLAAEKVTRKSLDGEDQRRLIEEAVGELDFSVLERND